MDTHEKTYLECKHGSMSCYISDGGAGVCVMTRSLAVSESRCLFQGHLTLISHSVIVTLPSSVLVHIRPCIILWLCERSRGLFAVFNLI